MESKVFITEEKIDVSRLEDWVWSPTCGATLCFLGKVRNHNESKKVLSLEYSAYKEMAEKEMHKIVEEAFHKWPFEKCIFVHRVGRLCVGETAVALLISSFHRKEAYEASQFIMRSLKKTVPLWKKEFYEDGSLWLGVQCQHE
ncbi:MAG: molybdenum cofactor biosynthesis protein MoaE [Deltaproteobacteria bacterium]|nr:molybdenum cofactor biosynthesis protein MoaE [Deltaproteobacteria bacterium]